MRNPPQKPHRYLAWISRFLHFRNKSLITKCNSWVCFERKWGGISSEHANSLCKCDITFHVIYLSSPCSINFAGEDFTNDDDDRSTNENWYFQGFYTKGLMHCNIIFLKALLFMRAISCLRRLPWLIHTSVLPSKWNLGKIFALRARSIIQALMHYWDLTT